MIKTHNNKIIKNILKSFKNNNKKPPSSTNDTFYCWFGAVKNDKNQLDKVKEFKYKIVLPKD